MAPAPEELDAPPRGRPRTVAYIVIGVAVVLQLVIPLRYYLGDDPYDERFSWRMFSQVRVVSCQARAMETAATSDARREVPLIKVIHEAWKSTLERNREGAVRAFLRRRCRDEDTSSVELTNYCVSVDQRQLPPITWSIDCESGEIEAPPDEVLAEVRVTADDEEPDPQGEAPR